MDEANIRINATVLDMYLDNETTTNIVQSDNRRFYRDDGVYPVKRLTAGGGGGVDVVWRNAVLIAASEAIVTTQSAHTASLAAISTNVLAIPTPPTAAANAAAVWSHEQ